MVLDPRKKQKKLERRKAKEKRRALAERGSRDIAERFERAEAAPILDCCVTRVIWEQGIGNLLLSRVLPKGGVAFAAFLVDTYCLGVKNVTYGISSRAEYDWRIRGRIYEGYEVLNLAPQYARKLVESAVEYAASLGIPPHGDYRVAKEIFGDIDAAACVETFEFGKDGKPYFIGGPHDSPAKCERIVAILRDRLGPEGFHFTFPIGASEALAGAARARIGVQDEQFDDEDPE